MNLTAQIQQGNPPRPKITPDSLIYQRALRVECALDNRIYEKGVKASDAEMASLDITGDTFHPEWNYTIKPRPPA